MIVLLTWKNDAARGEKQPLSMGAAASGRGSAKGAQERSRVRSHALDDADGGAQGDDDAQEALTGQQATLNAAAFCQVLETAGLRSVVYMNGHWSGAMYDLDALADWPIWYAGYGQPPTLERGVLLWQYTEEGTLPGITGPVDMDLWFEKPDT